MLSFIIKFLLVIFVIAVLVGSFRTWQLQNDPRQVIFSAGTVPNPLPDGFYKGTVSGEEYSWLGKKFDAANSKGINVFNDGFDSRNERHVFITYLGKESYNKNHDVLKLDYNIPGNPFRLRLFSDEIVQIAPDEYLGKSQLRIIPGFAFGLSYFELKKTSQ